MAKLGARNSVVLAKVAIDLEFTVEQDSSIEWSRTTYALRSDGKILVKRDVRFRATGDGKSKLDQAYFHTWGWKLTSPLRTLKAGATAESWAEKYVAGGYTRVAL